MEVKIDLFMTLSFLRLFDLQLYLIVSLVWSYFCYNVHYLDDTYCMKNTLNDNLKNTYYLTSSSQCELLLNYI